MLPVDLMAVRVIVKNALGAIDTLTARLRTFAARQPTQSNAAVKKWTFGVMATSAAMVSSAIEVTWVMNLDPNAVMTRSEVFDNLDSSAANVASVMKMGMIPSAPVLCPLSLALVSGRHSNFRLPVGQSFRRFLSAGLRAISGSQLWQFGHSVGLVDSLDGFSINQLYYGIRICQ